MNIEDMSLQEIMEYVNKTKREERDTNFKAAVDQCERIKNELVGKFFKHKDHFGETQYYYFIDVPEIQVTRMGDFLFTPNRLPVLKITTELHKNTIYPAIQDEEFYCPAGSALSPYCYLTKECGYTQITAQDFVEEYSRRLLMFFNQQKEN